MFKCEICGKLYKTMNDLAVHLVKRHHKKLEDYYDEYIDSSDKSVHIVQRNVHSVHFHVDTKKLVLISLADTEVCPRRIEKRVMKSMVVMHTHKLKISKNKPPKQN